MKTCASIGMLSGGTSVRMTRAISPYALRPSPSCDRFARLPRTPARSDTGCVSNCAPAKRKRSPVRDPPGGTCRNASMACVFASANASRAHAERIVHSDQHHLATLRIACDCAGGHRASQRAAQAAASAAQRISSSAMYFRRRCLTELCVRLSKNINELNGSGFDLMLLQQMHIERNARRASNPPRNHGERKPTN